MRVLRLRFMNLNSLAGVWDIDFTHPDYVSSGIFAITGPTGAGKTTILDALCVALYGQTPRLNKITQSANEIMSRQTGECFAEVEFETARGRFRCHWSQHRSRKRADGQLQAPKHEIVEAGSGKIIESKLTAVAKKVEEVTGMDFERFTRSMLLAQGGFAAFLQATPDKRAPILEQITGTAIYSRISMKVHDCTTEQRKKLEAMRLELDGMQLLASEEEEALQREQTEKQQEETTLLAAVRGIHDAQAWKERLAQLEGEIAQLEEAWLSFEAKKRAATADLECLAQAARAMTLEGDYAHIIAVRKQQTDEQSELTNAEEMLPKAQQEVQSAIDALGQAELELKKARDEQQREAELIRATRELDVKLAEANSRLKGLQTDSEAIKGQCDGHRTALAKYEAEVRDARALLGNSVAFLDDHRADAGLVEALTGIEQQIKTLKALNLQCTERRNKLESHASLRASAEQALHQAQTGWVGSSQAVEEAGNRLGVIQAARDTLLQGRELPSWREESESLSTRQNRLGNLKDTLMRIGETGQRQDALQVKRDTLDRKRQDLVGQEEDLARECGLREEVTRQLQDKLVLLNRVRDLEEERGRLVDGAPCPLCGAIEHPYAAGNVPRPDEVQQELEQARSAYKGINERLSNVRMGLAGVSKEIEQAQQEQRECREKQKLDEALCVAGFIELAISGGTSQRDDVIRIELDACQRALSTCREVIREAEGMEQELLRANTVRDTAREELNRHDKVRHTAELGCQTAVAEQERLTRECETLRKDLDQALAEAKRAIEPYGCRDIVPDNADGMFAALSNRRNDYTQGTKEKERLEKALAELDAKRKQEQALLGAAETNLVGGEQRLTDCAAQRDNLAGQRRELFGERNPDIEEQRLAAALSQSVKRHDEALGNQQRLHNECNGLEQRIQKLTGSIAIRTAQMVELESALLVRMNQAGFNDEAAFLPARLPQARFDELSRISENLRRNELEIQTRRLDRATALQQELDKKLTEKTLDQISEESSAATTQLSDLQKALGGIEQKLLQHAEQQQRQKDRLQAMEKQKKECARWEHLHALIGSSDGKKFRNFAQGLTFELMVAHANRQLQKMSDRYILVRDTGEPLELNVIDNYQAGEIRSTKNLSGGESFIASLALSLGLSSMASRNVRVDSLFLDEGFGTLDEDALETALETLSGLQQDGKLIGIISHVPALKERIGARIQVEAGSAGRSSLSGPGVSRL
jgi:DNA repair protein SbcC/Rad50